MERIHMKTPVVEMDGDEMTRILWEKIKETLLCPYVDLKTEYYDLGLKNRDKTEDGVSAEAARAVQRLKVGVKCATITPNIQRMEEYGLKKLWDSPNATIRGILGGTVFRVPILAQGIQRYVPGWEQPITVARHAYGDIYKAVEFSVEEAGDVALVYTKKNGEVESKLVAHFEGPGVVMGIHNFDDSITHFARTCMQYACDTQQDLYFAAKDTILKEYDHRFKDIFQGIYDCEFKSSFERQGIEYFYTLIDDFVARLIRSKGGFVFACKNYDGDVLSDLIASAFGSLAMMTSVLVTPHGEYEYEAAHGTVTRHYYQYLRGESTSTNPMATLFAWTGALKKRGELDCNDDLIRFAELLEVSSVETVEAGVLTRDLYAIADISWKKEVDTEAFLSAISQRLKSKLQG